MFSLHAFDIRNLCLLSAMKYLWPYCFYISYKCCVEGSYAQMNWIYIYTTLYIILIMTNYLHENQLITVEINRYIFTHALHNRTC